MKKVPTLVSHWINPYILDPLFLVSPFSKGNSTSLTLTPIKLAYNESNVIYSFCSEGSCRIRLPELSRHSVSWDPWLWPCLYSWPITDRQNFPCPEKPLAQQLNGSQRGCRTSRRRTVTPYGSHKLRLPISSSQTRTRHAPQMKDLHLAHSQT